MLKTKKITKITIKNKKTKVYDFSVENAKHYILEDGTISHNSYVPTNEMSGGGGAKYAADTIVFLSKKKNRDETTKEVKGNFIRVLMNKSRMTKENSVVEVLLDYVKGLDKYYGLLPIAMAAGIFVKKAKGMEYVPTGKTVYEKDLVKNPELYYTPEVLEKINEKVKKMFLYGQTDEAIPQMIHQEDFGINPELLNE